MCAMMSEGGMSGRTAGLALVRRIAGLCAALLAVAVCSGHAAPGLPAGVTPWSVKAIGGSVHLGEAGISS